MSLPKKAAPKMLVKLIIDLNETPTSNWRTLNEVRSTFKSGVLYHGPRTFREYSHMVPWSFE